MDRKQIGNSGLLALTAFIWGIAFVAQSEGGDAVGPYSFNCVRSFLGAAVLLPVIAWSDKRKRRCGMTAKTKNPQALLAGGALCGIFLAVATTAQQMGMYYGTAPGKAGFLTACYILIVPVMGIFFGKKCGWNIWLGVALAFVGLYFLCMDGADLSMAFSDLLVILCSFLFAVQIMLVDHYAPVVDRVRLACLEFFVCGVICALPMIFLEVRTASGGVGGWLAQFFAPAAWITIGYAGVFSCGVAYTLQIIGQSGLHPTLASLLMSLESVFSVLAGRVILGDRLSSRELAGCGIIFAAIVLAQLPQRRRDCSIG